MNTSSPYSSVIHTAAFCNCSCGFSATLTALSTLSIHFSATFAFAILFSVISKGVASQPPVVLIAGAIAQRRIFRCELCVQLGLRHIQAPLPQLFGVYA